MLSQQTFLLLLASLLSLATTSQQQQSFSNVCQSGIREDNTNYIYCARRSLTDVPIFSKNNVVYDELVLADNKITKLTSASFARIKVKKIYLNGNPIKSIEPTSFAKLENHLEELWLDADSSILESPIDVETESLQSSSIIGLPKAIVNYLRNLNTLRLKGLYVKVLENSVLKRLNRIEVLSLQFCSIEKIEQNAFEGLHNSLKELYLDGNLLQSIPTEALVNAAFKSLKVLSISQNNIKTINSDSFGVINYLQPSNYPMYLNDAAPTKSNNLPITTLNKLDLSYNGLKAIDSQAFNGFNNSLETLLLQNNEINSYNLKFLRQLNSLKELNLDFNLISKLTNNLFVNSQRLHFISLQGNSISFEENDANVEEQSAKLSVFDGLSGLQRLNLARNGIKYLPSNLFLPMKQLKSLILDKNQIENLNEFTFDGLFKSLMNISLQNTKMKSKHLISLKNLERLERVKLGFNELTNIEWSTFNKMHSTLTNLDLQNNQIDSITINITNDNYINDFTSLLDLDLSNNKFCNFNTKLLEKTPKLKNLGLSQNPLYCDCHLLPLYEWTRRKFEKDMLSFIQWQCEVPKEESDNFEEEPSFLNSKRFNKRNRRKFTSLASNDFVCFTNISKCSANNLVVKQQLPQSSSIKMTQNPFSLKFTSTEASKQIIDMNSFMRTTQLAQPTVARISNIQLTNKQNSIEIDWELDVSDQNLLNDIKGFKISYNQLTNNENSSSSIPTSIENDQPLTSFITDKYQRNFKLDNLNFNTRYTVCVSILRTQGYDKYCKEINTPFKTSQDDFVLNKNNTNEIFKKSTMKQMKTISSSSSNYVSNNDNLNANLVNANLNGFNNTNVVSGLMITVLVILICFIIALISFIFVYIRKRNNGSNGTKQKINKSKSSLMNHSSTLNTMNSRRNYSGAILATTNTNTSHRHPALEHVVLSQHQFLNGQATFCACNNQNCNFLAANTLMNTNENMNVNICCNTNANNIKMGSSGNTVVSSGLNDTSTVSSTLSSVANTTGNSSNQSNSNNACTNMFQPACMYDTTETNANCMMNDILTISPNNQQQAAFVMASNGQDLLASSPSSFTHFKINQPQQAQLPVSYIPYELYNCYQAENNQMNNNTSTLILPILNQQNQQVLLKQYLTMSHNSNNKNNKKMSAYEKAKLSQVMANTNNTIGNTLNQYGFLNTQENNGSNNDHVYCEIPSTIGRSYRQNLIFYGNSQDTQHLLNANNVKLVNLSNNNANNLNSYDHLISSNVNQVIDCNDAANGNNSNRYSQQNSSASLLLSSSSSSSTTPSTSSPKASSNQSNTTNHTNKIINSNKITGSII